MADYQLADKFRLESGRVFLSGVQAVARLAVDQLRIDRRLGLTTAAFASGYQGSPVGTFTEELQRAHATVPDLPIIVQPGVNEELAATAVMGSQLAMTLDDAKYDGVVGVWYGKGPGFDRSSDAIRHAVFAGTSQHGGVVAVVGDDPAAKSSTVPSSSDATMVDLHMPVLFPGDVQEALDLSRHAVALSRSCGLWSGLKLVTPVADGTGTIDVDPDRVQPTAPVIEVNGAPFVPTPNGRLLTPYTLDMEIEFQQVRTELARQYGVDNHLNRLSVQSSDDWVGIAACGSTYHEVRQALTALGLGSDDELRRAGVRLFQLLMPIPLDPEQVREFADGLDEILVIEEKNPTLEGVIKSALYDGSLRSGRVGPRVVGRHDERGEVLFNGFGTLDVDKLLEPLHGRLSTRLGDRLRPLDQLRPPPRELIPLSVDRTPFYCSGCPHNASTRAEPGTLIGGGIGCHSMVAFMEPERVGDIVGLTQMGGEGAQWIGISPFIERDHLIQNLGDGTFFHSGSLAIRAAIAAEVDITYKLLYNGTVAMTGGQDPQGQLSVPDVAQLLTVEGVKQIIVTSDDPGRHDRADFPDGVRLWDRSRLTEAQQVLSEVSGVTVLIHDQACAAESRRGRSRGLVAKPTFRVVINERVCEGCGDCGDVSNCLSVQPVDTAYGRKTKIHQTSCNFDYSCMKGDCPSFATVTLDADDAGPERSLPTPPSDIAEQHDSLVDPANFTVRLTGIGGTGVITVSQILGTAAMLADCTVRGLDQTGLSQKAGPVVSDVTITTRAHADDSTPGIDAILAFDLLVGARDANLHGARADRTVMIASTDTVPTGSMVTDPTLRLPTGAALAERVASATRSAANRYLDAAALAEGLLGSTTTANIIVLGAAVQAGAIPLPPAAIEQAITLNGVAVETNLAAFHWGRAWIDDPARVERAADLPGAAVAETDDELIDRLSADLVDYQSEPYAQRFRDVVDRARRAEEALGATPATFTRAVAIHLHRLMAYKDEYEVARLLLLDESGQRYRAIGGEGTTVTYHLHPPMLRSLGLDRKLKLQRSALPALRALAVSKRLRGTLADPFRWAEVRKVERAMVPEYVAAITHITATLSASNRDEATDIASLPDQVRGYEDLKLRRANAYRSELSERMRQWPN